MVFSTKLMRSLIFVQEFSPQPRRIAGQRHTVRAASIGGTPVRDGKVHGETLCGHKENLCVFRVSVVSYSGLSGLG
jgi:hypothetical protein